MKVAIDRATLDPGSFQVMEPLNVHRAPRGTTVREHAQTRSRALQELLLELMGLLPQRIASHAQMEIMLPRKDQLRVPHVLPDISALQLPKHPRYARLESTRVPALLRALIAQTGFTTLTQVGNPA